MILARDGGYDAVNMRDVASRAEVALGTLYRYYPSKDVLLLHGLAGWARYVRQQLRELEPEGATPAERLAWALTLTAEWSDAQPKLMKALMTALGSTDPATVDAKAEVEHVVRGIIVDAVGGARDVDVESVRRVIGHVWFSATMRWVSGLAPTGSVGPELALAAHLLLDRP